MQAKVGDRILVRSHHTGEPDRTGEILEVHGADGGAPYLVHWDEDGHEGLFFPGSDSTIETLAGATANKHRRRSS